MKTLALDAPGLPDDLVIMDLPRPKPGPGEVLVKVEAVGLNPVDYKTAGRGNPAWQYPHILGLDVAGTVEALGRGGGSADTGGLVWKPGDRVYYHGNLAKPGGYAEFSVAPAHILAGIADSVSFEQAAAIPCAGFTAWQILTRKMRTRPGQSILVHGGAGGVGGFAVQMARGVGLFVLTTCSQGNFELVKELGADHAIDYRAEDVTQRVRELTGQRGVDFAVNTISGESATLDFEHLAFNGHLACVAGLPDFRRIEPFTRAISVHESALGGAHLSGDRPAQEDLALMGKELMAQVRDHKLSPMLAEVIALKDIPQALNRLMRRHVRGKIVALID